MFPSVTYVIGAIPVAFSHVENVQSCGSGAGIKFIHALGKELSHLLQAHMDHSDQPVHLQHLIRASILCFIYS